MIYKMYKKEVEENIRKGRGYYGKHGMGHSYDE